ncbi:serine--tRNA ligase [Candidatus Margulisiibacteriota bacterium]
MIDLKILRNEPEILIKALQTRGEDTSFIDNLIEIDKEWRELSQASDDLKNKQKKKSKSKPSPEEIQKLKEMADEIKNIHEKTMELDEKRKEILLTIPNIPQESVPLGKDPNDNKVIRTWGEPKKVSFKPKSHEELAEELGWLDFARGAKIAESRFVIYKGKGATLERKMINLMLDTHIKNHNYTEIIPPCMVNEQSMIGTGQLPKFAEELYKCKDDNLYLIPTAEVPLTNMYQDEILPEEDLPINLVSYTPCFRREAGSYGKDTKGIIRIHQFNKVELVKFTTPQNSQEEHEKLTADAEKILQMLDLPYRVVELCTGDLGFASSKTYDLEIWFPSQNMYREVSSCSNFTDFQARRAGIRYKDNEGKTNLVHTINGSGLAIGRTFAALLENYQEEDGSISLPDILK